MDNFVRDAYGIVVPVDVMRNRRRECEIGIG